MTRGRKFLADGSGALPALEAVCEVCGGDGKLPSRRTGERAMELGGPCNACHAKGTVVTEDGRRLLEFLWQHQR